ELPLGVVVDPVDAGPGEDVVELVDQQALPCRVEQLPGVSASGRDGPELGLAKRLLRSPVESFRPRLRGVGAAVELEVKLADPGHQATRLPLGAAEEFGRATELDGGRTLDAAQAVSGLEHVRFRTAAAVAPAIEVEGVGGPIGILEVGRALHDLG